VLPDTGIEGLTVIIRERSGLVSPVQHCSRGYVLLQDLLNFIYSALDPAVPPFSYGREWSLFGSRTAKVFEKIGPIQVGV
jgi:hypothetical protein